MFSPFPSPAKKNRSFFSLPTLFFLSMSLDVYIDDGECEAKGAAVRSVLAQFCTEALDKGVGTQERRNHAFLGGSAFLTFLGGSAFLAFLVRHGRERTGIE